MPRQPAQGGGGFAMPGMPGTTGLSNGHPDISSLYGAIPTASTPSIPTGDDGGFNGPMTGDTPDFTPEEQAARAAGGASGAASQLSQLGSIAGVGMAGYSLATNTIGAFENDNPLKGALGDAAAGAVIGSLIPGVGTAIGAAAGAAIGASAGILGYVTGMGGNMAARSYYQQQIFPQLQADYANAGNGDFQSEISNANRTASDAMGYMRAHFGASSADWVNDNYMKKELTRVTALIAASAEGGRQFVTMSASQFHAGGRISDFGSFGTSSTECFIHAMMGETVMNPSASSTHGPILDMMNSGASATDIAARYLAGSTRSMGGGGSTYNGGDIHIHTLDTKTMKHWLTNGGAQMITNAQNNFNAQYAGDGISG